jgi:hypothetical protein
MKRLGDDARKPRYTLAALEKAATMEGPGI